MGLGAESAGGYEIDYNPYDFDLSNGFQYWTDKNGMQHSIKNMSNSHIKNTIKVCQRLSSTVTFSADAELWDSWIEVFEEELAYRNEKGINITSKSQNKKNKNKKPCKSIKLELGTSTYKKYIMICNCGKEYVARRADLERGWGLSCSKKCASIRRTYNRAPAKIKEGLE